MSESSRRALLAGAAGVGAAAALAACNTAPENGTSTPGDGGANTGAPAGSTPTGGTAPEGGAAQGLAKKADIPVGGGKIFGNEGVVITQPQAGTFKGFSSACTHQGCTVSAVSNGTITCACHGSAYSAADGSVKNGPATRALAAKAVKVEGESISLA